jgi:hypothetical protein
MFQQTGWSLVTFLVLLGLSTASFAQEKPKEFPDFAEIVTNEFQKYEGYYNIYHNAAKEEGYLEIPGGALEQDFLVATTITGGTVFTGFQWSDDLLYWKRFDKKLALLRRQINYRADAGTPVGNSVARTYTDTLVTSYGIVTLNGGNPVINLRSFTLGGIPTFFGYWFSPGDSSMIKFNVKAFANNVELSLNFPDRWGDFITLHYSIRNLPASDFASRPADDRVGYFLTAHKNLSSGKADDGYFVRYINRWNLKKVDGSLKKSPVVEPIVFYIEKTVPLQYRQYVREGIEEWNKAFEKLGYYQAIVVRQQTESNEFKDLDPADSRYNFFRWITSEMPFAMGPSRVDPRTGEILDADILFDDSFIQFSLLEYDRMIREESTAGMSPRYKEFLKKYPEKHPLAKFQRNMAPSEDPFDQKQIEKRKIIQEVIEERQRNGARSLCLLGEGRSHQMNLACCYFGFVMNEGEGGGAGGETPAEAPKENPFPEEFVGQVLKDTVMHEVGHTLGLRHNFKASAWRSLSEINKKDGPADLSGSVMDYNPTNIKSVEKDAVQGNYAMTTLGPYDYWAIEYGYTMEDAKLGEIAAKLATPGNDYGTDEDAWSPDPSIRRWDLGNDPLVFAKERIGLANRIMENIMKRALKKGEGFQNFKAIFQMSLFEQAISALRTLDLVGGEQVNRDHFEDPNGRDPLVVLGGAKQREALQFASKQLLHPDAYSFKSEVLTKLAPANWMHWGCFVLGILL